jgi:hypothetical protein
MFWEWFFENKTVRPTPPTNLYQYQNKRLTEFAFRKLQIPEEMFWQHQPGSGADDF